jgi:integrase
MIVVKEHQDGNEVYYEYQIKEGNTITLTESLRYKLFTKEHDGMTYIILYNPHMQPISEAFGFLNSYLVNQSIHTKGKDAQALKLLFTYQSIIDKELSQFTASDIEALKYFIAGVSMKGQAITYDLVTQRSNKTINEYLSIYRKYLTYLDKTNEYLSAKNNKKVKITHEEIDVEFDVSSYKSNETVPNEIVEVPRYISVKEFNLILEEIQMNYGIREEIIVRLMFQLGLRIGEVLGLTNDDFVIENVETEGDVGVNKPVCFVYIRNRVSDQPFQKAKRLMKVKDVSQYKSDAYLTKNYGYNKIPVPKDLYELINDYIEEAHVPYLIDDEDTNASAKKKSSYNKHTIADRVRRTTKDDDFPNFYIFINSLGTPLSQTLWNYTMRKIFEKLDITVDLDVKEHNLNHRFRHGYAMFNVQYRGIPIVELKELMRHRSIQTTAIYYRPTTSDAVKLKTEFTEDLYELCPALKRKE